MIGVDLGGTKTAGAVVDLDGQVLTRTAVPTPAAGGAAALLDAVAALVTDLAGSVNALVRGVGIGTAGVVDVPSGRIVAATDILPGWAGTAVPAGLRARVPALGAMPVHVQNDVDAHAAGEVWLGAAAGLDTVLLIAVGTGVGGAVVRHGQVLRGAHRMSGDVAHMPTPGAEGLRCACGRLGHLEALASGPSLHRYYLASGGDPHSPDTRDVVARAQAGEETAIRAVRTAATALGRAMAGAAAVLDPDAVIITGGMAGAGALWWQTMESTFRGELAEPLAQLPVRRAQLADGAILGAARGAWDQVKET
ncbi:ROK family protein [Ruania alba]|uniref:ROK family protein n=1 Tax=Ruania alba TaxID=648782 RepID=UPI001FDEA766|nr:ROK family protein [Ruania alba]